MIQLSFAHYGDAIGNAATVLRSNASSTGLAAPVPSCPGWQVRDLVIHQGAVHRWARDFLAGDEDGHWGAHEAEGAAAVDLLEWFDQGATALLDTLSKTPPDADVFFFLRNAANPRDGWARRQTHETTIHAVDAVTARLGRAPLGSELWFGPELATDGIDELLTGFLPRKKSRLRSETAYTIGVRTTDTGEAWTIAISAEPPTVARGAAAADVEFSGTAAGLYLGLWNRGGEITSTDDAALAAWRELAGIG